MAVLNIVLSLILLEAFSKVYALEETFVQMPSSLEDEDSYFYMDTRSETDPKQSETRRRSTLDKNFARFGRGDLAPLAGGTDYDSADGYVESVVARRAGSGVKNDHFVRFGRGNSDFVRFGRDPYRVARGGQRDQHFIRFGRSVTRPKPRNKREAATPDFAKRPSSNNFVRFGRNDNFMRFGRQPEEARLVPEEAKQRQSNYKEEYFMRMLMDYLARPHPHDQPSRLA